MAAVSIRVLLHDVAALGKGFAAICFLQVQTYEKHDGDDDALALSSFPCPWSHKRLRVRSYPK